MEIDDRSIGSNKAKTASTDKVRNLKKSACPPSSQNLCAKNYLSVYKDRMNVNSKVKKSFKNN